MLVTVILPDKVPAAVGLYAAVNVALVAGAKLTGSVIPETTTVPTEDATLEIVTCAVPMFCRRIVCVVLLPTTTLPKLTEAGVAESVEDVAVALRLICVVGLLALLVSVSIPASVPAAVGLYVTVKLTDCPAANVAGTVRPVTVTPVPVNDILVIEADPAPVFASFTVCVAWLPTATLPKATDAGVAVSAAEAAAAVPPTLMLIGDPTALLVTVILPAKVPAAVGLYAAVKLAVFPAAKLRGSVIPETTTLPTDDATLEIVTCAVPVFCS